MPTPRDIQALTAPLAAFVPPVLSMYVDLRSYGAPGDQQQALKIVVESVLKRLIPPTCIAAAVRAFFSERLLNQAHGRTLALFADATRLHALHLSCDLGLQTRPHGGPVEARWGEFFLAPLLLALQKSVRYLIVYLDRNHGRLFSTSLQHTHCVAELTREPSASEQQALASAPGRHPAYLPQRGSAVRDDAARHMHHIERRFFAQLAALTEKILAQEPYHGLVLLSPQSDLTVFEAMLSANTRASVRARLPGLAYPEASSATVLEHVTTTLNNCEAQRQSELLDHIGAAGIWGVDVCLRALQENRLFVLATHSATAAMVYQNSASGYVASTAAQAAAHNGDGLNSGVRAAALLDILPPLVTKYAAQIELIDAPHPTQRLLQDFGGMGALTRW